MQVLVLFILACFLVGGSGFGRVVRDRPVILMGCSTVVAASYYLLRVVM